MSEFNSKSKEKIRVLIISQYFPPDVSGAGTRAFNYAYCLAQQNYDVTVITGHPHLHSKVPKEYRRKLIYRSKMNNCNIIRVWIPSLLHTSALNRISLHFSFIVTSLLPILSIKSDIIFASEPNLFSIIPAYIYSKIRGGKIIRVVDDLWPEVIYERGYVKSKLLKKILDHLARFSYEYPKYVLPLTQEAKELIHDSYSINDDKIKIILHGVDPAIYNFKEREREEYFVVMYSGSLVESYDFDMMINAAEKLKEKKIKFIVRGKGLLYQYIKEQKERHNLNNLIIDTEMVPLSEISNVLSKADVFAIPLKNEYALNMSLPTKILEYQAVGRPIICCSDGAPGNYIEKTKSGIRVACGDIETFVDAIIKLKSDSNFCNVLGNNGREYVKENLTLEKIGMKLSEIIQLILNTK